MKDSYLEITNQQGWRKECVLAGGIIRIGEGAAYNLQLPEATALGANGSLLLQPMTEEGDDGYKLFNFSRTKVIFVPCAETPNNPQREIEERKWVRLADEDRVRFGHYELCYHSGDYPSAHLSIDAILPDAMRLYADQLLQGRVLVTCRSDHPIQLVLQIDDTYVHGHPDSAPLSSVMQGQITIPFSLEHPKAARPRVGYHTVAFYVTAPDAFPHEKAKATRRVWIGPYPAYQIALKPSPRQRQNRSKAWVQRLFGRTRKQIQV